jgi:hypothetical protein
MGDYLMPILFLAVVFTAFGLVHRNRRSRSCGDCSDSCDKTRCENKQQQF